MLSEQARKTIEEVLEEKKRVIVMVEALGKRRRPNGTVDEIDAALAEVRALSQPLDAPDAPGWWAWEGYINYAKGCDPSRAHREVVRVHWGSTTKQWQVVREHGRHPASMLIGKWWKVQLPWEVQP